MTAPPSTGSGEGTDMGVHRLCIFELALSCGHLVTAAVTGWYPVRVACCDRLGGTSLRGDYVAYTSDVDFVEILSERYESRPTAAQAAPTRLIGRRSRTDGPIRQTRPGGKISSGRFPAWVGSIWSLDSPIAAGSPD